MKPVDPRLVAVIAVALTLAACQQGVVGPALPSPSFVVSDGTALKLISVDGDELTVVDTASVPGDLLPGHRIFNVAKHPSLPLYYSVSSNDCNPGDSWCWGNGRIDAFRVVDRSITHEFAFVEDGSQLDIACARVDSGFEGQAGLCAPNGLVFSADGSRLYVDDDYLDGVQVFAVDE